MKNLDKQKVFETPWFSIDAISYTSSTNEPYYVLSCNNSVGIVAMTSNGHIVLVRQHRPAVGSYMLELPAGYVMDNETSKEAIERELREETGFVCESVTSVGTFKICPSRINNNVYFFFGKAAKATDTQRTAKKKIDIVLVTPEEFERLILEGKFIDIAGIAFYFLSRSLGLLSPRD